MTDHFIIPRPNPVMMCMPTGGPTDIPTGDYIPGTHGQMVLNAGLAPITGFVGPGNCFKTTIMRCFTLSAINRLIMAIGDIPYYSYDTEINTQERGQSRFLKLFKWLRDRNLISENVWMITNRALIPGNEYHEMVRTDILGEKMKGKGKKYPTAFLDRDGVSPMMVMHPTFGDTDSLSEFVTADVEKIQEGNELGEAGGNMLFARQGLAKKRMLGELPVLAARGFYYVSFTAHLGVAMLMGGQAPGTPPPRKQLQGMNQNEIIKGVTNAFFYLLHNCWLLNSARPYINQDTKGPQYPYNPGEERPGDADLNLVSMKQLRGKNGGSNYTIDLVVSGREGVLFALSDYEFLKKVKKYGMGGNDLNHYLELLPTENLRRTTIRKQTRENEKLCRALEITREMAQIEIWLPQYSDIMMSPKELYDNLKEKGYDWDWLLENTRGYNTINDEAAPLYPLSTLDFCRVARGLYHPYWLEADCKTVKEEFAKKKVGATKDA